MQAILALFPARDYTLLSLIVLLPLLGAAVNGVFGKRLGKEAVSLLALSVIFISFVLSVLTFFALGHAQQGETAARFYWKGWEWFHLTQQNGNSTTLNVAFSVDALSGTMALIVTGVGFLIHLYSVSYMAEDPGFHRFLTYLNLFIFSMLVLILGDSLPVLFVGWEGVGLCSYLLIGFWFETESNAAAGKKAFVTNRIGDFGLLVAMGLLLYYTGALDWSGIEGGAKNLLTPVQVWPLGTHVPAASLLPAGAEHWVNMPRYVSAATLVGLALFLGCAGKSAQLPLYVWLPDAMAGPTPVSALIHAATMVTAGVYLLCRLSFVMVLSPAAMAVVAFTGALTALFAASIAFAQHDIKKVLAYSTVSQLGYMFLGVGVGAFTAGFFHVITHAFFKACMFLGAGSVIHAMHARIHDTDASQDMRNMGGLRKYMPITFWTFAASWAAIVGFPLSSGFFSKDEILFKAYSSFVNSPVPGNTLTDGGISMELFTWPTWLGSALYAMGLLTAVMTAFYMTRLFIGIFFGEFKGWKIVKGFKEAQGHDEADHGHGHAHHDPGVRLEGPTPHESPWQMVLPLAILGALAAFSGFFNANAGPIHITPLDSWLEPVFAKASGAVSLVAESESKEPLFLGLAFAAFAVGSGVAYWVYAIQKGKPAQSLVNAAPGFHSLVFDKWRVDEFYDEYVIGAVDSLAEFFTWADKWIVDFILTRVSSFLIAASGTALRFMQTGRVQTYAAVMVLGLGGVGYFFVTPRVEAETKSNDASGAYSLSAAQGLGYSYRWDLNNDGKWDTEKFSSQTRASLKLAVKENRTVRLEVKNAFGRTATRSFDFARPQPDLSGALSRGSPDQVPLRRMPNLRQLVKQGAAK